MFLTVHLVNRMHVSGIYRSPRGTFMLQWAYFLPDPINVCLIHQFGDARTVCARKGIRSLEYLKHH